MVITIPNGWYAELHYVNDDLSLYATIVSWTDETYEVEQLDGVHNIMLNIKYGSAGATNITQQMVNSVDWVIALYYVTTTDGYYPAASYEEFSELRRRVDTIDENIDDIPLNIVLENCVRKYEGEQTEVYDMSKITLIN